MVYRIIPLKNRLRIREIARQSLEDHRDDPQTAIAHARRRIRRDPQLQSLVMSLLLSLAIRLAIALIMHWIDQQFSSVPRGHFVKGEPGS